MNPGRLAITLPAPFVDALGAVSLARRAEQEWGYEAIWLAETNAQESFALAGAIAVATSRVGIGTAIVPVYNRTPAVLAMGTGTVAQLSGGRFTLGIGSSSPAIMDAWNGIPFERPLTRVRETVAVLRQAFRGEKTDFAGHTLRSTGFRLGAPAPTPPRIYLAGLRAKMLALAGEVGDGLIINFQPVSAMKSILAAYAEGARRAGRDASGDEVVSRFQVCVTDDKPAARNLVRMAFGGYVASPVYNRFFEWVGFEEVARGVREAFARGDRAGTAAAISDEFVDAVAIIGSAAECRERLAAFVEAGVTTPVISPLVTRPEAVAAVFEALAPSRLG